MKRFSLILLSALALPLLLTSCQDETADDADAPRTLTLTANLCGDTSADTRGTQYNTTGSNQTLNQYLTTFTVQGFRKGALETAFSSLFSARTATYNSTKSVYELASSAEWPARSYLRLYAYANLPNGAAAPTITKDGLTLAYTVPTTADAQNDVLLGLMKGKPTANADETTATATVTFSHPLTAVAIKKGTFKQEGSSKTSVPVAVKKIVLKNVYQSGTTTLDTLLYTDFTSRKAYSWTLPTTPVMQDVSQAPASPATKLAEVSATYGTGTGSTATLFGEPFILIPQNTQSTQVMLEVTIAPEGGKDVVLHAVIKDKDWLPGRTYLYELGYTFPKIPITVANVTVKALETTTPTTITFEN